MTARSGRDRVRFSLDSAVSRRNCFKAASSWSRGREAAQVAETGGRRRPGGSGGLYATPPEAAGTLSLTTSPFSTGGGGGSLRSAVSSTTGVSATVGCSAASGRLATSSLTSGRPFPFRFLLDLHKERGGSIFGSNFFIEIP